MQLSDCLVLATIAYVNASAPAEAASTPCFGRPAGASVSPPSLPRLARSESANYQFEERSPKLALVRRARACGV